MSLEDIDYTEEHLDNFSNLVKKARETPFDTNYEYQTFPLTEYYDRHLGKYFTKISHHWIPRE